MIDLLILLLILVVVVLIAVWLIDIMGLPHPINMILKVIVALIALLYLLQKSGLGLAV
jgi:hypothetical protein